MAKYKVVLTTVASFTTVVEAEDEEQAIEAAYDLAPRDVYGPNPQTMYAVDVNETWQLREPEADLVTED